MNWSTAQILIAGFFISIVILIYGGLIVSDIHEKSKIFKLSNKERRNYIIKRYVLTIIVLILIVFSIWLIDKGYIGKFFSDIFSSEGDYTPGECFPYGSCE